MSSDWGTLDQLKHAIHCTSVNNDPEHNMKAIEDFLLVTLFTHVTAAAKECIQSNSTGSDCNEIAEMLVSRYVKINLPSDKEDNLANDGVYNYAIDLLSIGLFWHGFHDTVKEGDSNRIVRYWKFLKIIFKQQGHYNYAKDAFNFIAQTLLLSPRQVMVLKWN